MKRVRLGQLERRKTGLLDVLQELGAGAGDTVPKLHPLLLGVTGRALGRFGLAAEGAEMVRRALDLANVAGDHHAGRRLLRQIDNLEDRPRMYKKPSRTKLRAARAEAARVRQVVELPALEALGAADLDGLEELRHDHPEAALCRLLPAADRLPRSLVVRFLGIAGSAYRLRALQRLETEADLRRGEEYLRAGLWAARKAGDVAGGANLLQRLGFVVAERGKHRQALGLAERAAGIYDRIGDRAGRGKALVDEGVFLNGLGRHREAIRAQSLALELLPESLPLSRFAALQGLGHLYRTIGDLDSAITYLNRASEIGGIPRAFAARLVWLRGSVLADLGDEPQAADTLRAAVELLRSVHYAETALATVELVRVLIRLGRLDEAHRTSLTVRQLVIPLRRNRYASAALAELLRGGAVLTLGRVDRVRKVLDQARQQRAWRLLKVRSDR